MPKVLVTGAGGYIGSVLTRLLLESGYGVRAVDRFFFGTDTLPGDADGLEIVRADIRWMDESVVAGVDAVIDLAALSNDPSGELAPDKTWAINHAGRVRVATMAAKNGVARYILPSSCSIYGFQAGVLDETSDVNPLTTYAHANHAAERDISGLRDTGFSVAIVRQATVYGMSPRMRFDLAINGMVRGMFKDGRIPILRDGSQWRPFVHVRDTSRAIIEVLEAPAELVDGEIFNVGSNDQNCQVMPLAKSVAAALGVPFEFEWYGSPDHRSYRVSFDKIERVLGFRTRFTPQDGAKEVHDALRRGELDPDDPRTITVKWYQALGADPRLQDEVALDGAVL